MYVVQTRPNEEKSLLKSLKNSGIKAYAPEVQMNIRRHGKWHIENKLVFSGYIFIDEEFSPKLYQTVRNLNGFLHFLGHPSPLRDDEENQIKWLCNNGTAIAVSHYFRNGREIIFTDGILSEQEFEFLKLFPRQKRAEICVSVKGKKFRIFLPAEKN